ncbi:glutathione S-transferase family protein [Paucibacter sp. XJ19-41]|uniref:glutathione S-transferase family protein n=1 Tax=Paucibacter sp. XJ19-41 TaxID=2927824 RepID=UPI00234BC489|nr:glutathione S-transferase family protein [Paucibacter sp. XJ19-41]MDC6171169.1 glutathione S-transferase family protein [Paucibacter sp. XJ19-41]
MSTGINLYGLSRSVYTRIARLTLEEKSVAYQLTETEIFGPGGVPPEHLARHPFGRIPVLVCGAISLYETAAICRYVDEAYEGPALQPTNPVVRARVAQIIGILDSYFYRPAVWGVFVERIGRPLQGKLPDEKVIDAALPQVRTALNALCALQQGAPYLAGEALTLADLHAFPMLKYLSLAPEGKAEVEGRRSLAEWLALLEGRASVQRTRSQFEQAPTEAA